MSEKMGPLAYGQKEEQIFLGREITQHKDYSEHTALEIDAEIKRLVMESYEKAKRLLLEHFDILTNMANTLLEKEVLEGHEIDAIVNEGLAKKAGVVTADKTENVAA